MARPRSDERAALSGHLPAEVEEELLAELRHRYPMWEIGRRDDGVLLARHRTEEPDWRLERAGVLASVTAVSPEQLESKLFVQRALRGDGAESDR